jgi:hypothetical protein
MRRLFYIDNVKVKQEAMRVVKKVGVYLDMLIFAVVVAGMYGVLHDQISLSKSFVVVMIVAFITGLGGLAYGYCQINEATIAANMQWVRPGVTDPIQFVRVGHMHNASYMGGVTGLIAGALYLIKQKLRLNKMPEVDQ